MKDEIPVMFYDGDCGFCRKWVDKWKKITGKKVQYKKYKNARCYASVQLIAEDGTAYQAAHAVFKAFSLSGRYKFLLFLYEHLPLFRWASERLYIFFAHKAGENNYGKRHQQN